MNRYLRQFFALVFTIGCGLLAYGALLASPVAHDLPILFYRGTLLAAVAALIAALAGIIVGRRWRIEMLALPAALVTGSLCLCFLVLFPVTIDRSISVYLLATIGNAEGTVTARRLERNFVAGYVVEMQAIDRRIDEQVRSGNVVVRPGNRLTLTPQGARFVTLSRRAAALFGTDPRFVAGYRPERAARRP